MTSIEFIKLSKELVYSIDWETENPLKNSKCPFITENLKQVENVKSEEHN